MNHLLSDTPAQNIKVEYGKVAELTCWNEPYGTLRIEKLSDTGAHLPDVYKRQPQIWDRTPHAGYDESGRTI